MTLVNRGPGEPVVHPCREPSGRFLGEHVLWNFDIERRCSKRLVLIRICLVPDEVSINEVFRMGFNERTTIIAVTILTHQGSFQESAVFMFPDDRRVDDISPRSAELDESHLVLEGNEVPGRFREPMLNQDKDVGVSCAGFLEHAKRLLGYAPAQGHRGICPLC